MKKERWTDKTGAVFCIGEWDLDYDRVLSLLGEEHFIENDPSKTHSGTERFWIFKLENNVALAFQYHDLKKWLLVGSNNPEMISAGIVSDFIQLPYKEISGKMWD